MILFLLPAAVFFLSCLMRFCSGPFWLATNSDPSYLYLFNALYILDGIPPMFTDHPGTPLQVLIAVIIKFFHPFIIGEQRVLLVASSAEYYLHIIWAVLLLFFVASAWLVGHVVRKRSGSLIAGLCVQFSGIFFLLLSSGNVPVLSNVTAEALLAGLMNLFVAALSPLVFTSGFKSNGSDRSRWQLVVLLACVSAACVTTKLTFLPLIFLPLFLLGSWRQGLAYMAGTFVFSALFILPIWPRIFKFASWVQGLIVMTGAHGSGQPGVMIPSVFLVSVWLWLTVFWPLTALALGGIVLVVMRRHVQSPFKFVIMVFSGFILFQFIFVVKQGGAQYLAPAVGLAGLLLALMAEFLMVDQLLAGSKVIFRGLVVCVVIIAVLSGVMVMVRASNLDKVRRDLTGFYQRVSTAYPGCVMAGAYRSSSPGFALFFGHSMHYYEGNRTLYFRYYAKILAKGWRDVYVYDYWTRWVSGFGRDIPLAQAAGNNACILVQTQETGRFQSSLWQEVDACASGEKLFRLRIKQ